jgi:hypothetical protein
MEQLHGLGQRGDGRSVVAVERCSSSSLARAGPERPADAGQTTTDLRPRRDAVRRSGDQPVSFSNGSIMSTTDHRVISYIDYRCEELMLRHNIKP